MWSLMALSSTLRLQFSLPDVPPPPRRELEFGLDACTFVPAVLLMNVSQLFHAEDGEKAFLLPDSRCVPAAA